MWVIYRLAVAGSAFLGLFTAGAHARELAGQPIAKEKAAQLVEAVGGAEVWSQSKSFMVRETVYLANGETADLVVKRNLDDITRWISLSAESFEYEEVLDVTSGWSGRDGNAAAYTPEELAAERRGLEQSPYYVYHRLAKNDPMLRVEWLEEENRLNIYEGSERLLCWFFLDGRGNPMSWANIYNERENRHNYGPMVDVGDANFPKWGAAADASWRFEYVEARFSSEPVSMPAL